MSHGWGVLCFFEKGYGPAEEKLQAVLETAPALNDARYQLSRTYWCMGKKDEAKALLEQYRTSAVGTTHPRPERPSGTTTEAEDC
jgi:thioredoxin-like negative regulator of GroEL